MSSTSTSTMGPLDDYWRPDTTYYSRVLPCSFEQGVAPENDASDEDDMYLFDVPTQEPPELYPSRQIAGQLVELTVHEFLPEFLLKVGSLRKVEGSPVSKIDDKMDEGVFLWVAMVLCPFYIQNPEKHLGCLTRSAFRDIKEVKQHLWNNHRLPRYCPTCYETFTTTKNCDRHIRSRSCSFRGLPRPEGITIEQMQRMAQRAGSHVSGEQQWLSLWAIVFPGADLPDVKYPLHAVEFVVCSFREFWSSNGEEIILHFLQANLYDYDELLGGEDSTALYTAVLHQTIDRLVEYFRYEDYDGMFGKAEHILASLDYLDWI